MDGCINKSLPALIFDKKRYRIRNCPCGKDNKDGKFVPYVGFENKGYCHSCGKTFLPDLPERKFTAFPKFIFYPQSKTKLQSKSISFIPDETFMQTLKNHDANNFVKFLFGLFGSEITKQLICRYFIATSKYWNGATVFWQIDKRGKIRAGKIMLYNPSTGKRLKEPVAYIAWVHKVIKLSGFELKQCFFGEHLLRSEPLKPIAIVESEKTAVIASVYMPQFIWIAVGGISNLNVERCSVLKDRKIILFPDSNGFERWSAIAKELSHFACFTVSDLLDRECTKEEKKQGLDIADYLIKMDFKKFIPPKAESIIIKKPLDALLLTEIKGLINIKISDYLNKRKTLEIWKNEINELERYFESIVFPTEPIVLNEAETIINVSDFVQSHLATLKKNIGNKYFRSFYDRLNQVKFILISKVLLK